MTGTERPWTAFYTADMRAEIGAVAYRTIGDLVRSVSATHGRAPAYTACLPNGMNGTLSFEQVDEMSDAFAVYLREIAGLTQAGRELAQRATAAGWQVGIADPGDGRDFNDKIREEGRELTMNVVPFEQWQEPAEGAEPLTFPPASRWAGKPVPKREWLVDGIIPMHQVTMISGAGGTGKSLLALQLGIATAVGHFWLGKGIEDPGPVVCISAEDDEDELHRRVADICAAEGVDLSDLDDFRILSLAGGDAMLAVPEGGVMRPTELYDRACQAIREIGPRLVILDTLADLHGGNENDRQHARQVIGLMRRISIEMRCAVILLSHPSLTGISSGTGTSGSTGWEGSVRSRLYFDRVRNEEGQEVDPDLRVLSMMKLNYGPIGWEMRMKYNSGRFLVEGGQESFDRRAAEMKAERVFLKLLDEFTREGRSVKSSHATGFAPKAFASSGRSEGVSKRALTDAMERLFAKGEIREEFGGDGPPAKHKWRIVRVPK